MKLRTLIVTGFLSVGAAASASAQAPRGGCLSDQEVEAVVAPQIQAGSFAINTAVLAGRPLCSGLQLYQQVQRIAEKFSGTGQNPNGARRNVDDTPSQGGVTRAPQQLLAPPSVPERPVQQQSAGSAAFEGQIIYVGNWTVTKTRVRRGNQVLRNPRPRDYQGTIRIVMNITGQNATAEVSGTNYEAGRWTGTFSNGYCRFVGSNGIEVYEGRCDTQSFIATILEGPASEYQSNGRISASAESVISAAEIRAAAAKAKAEAAAAEAKARAEAAAAAARYAALPNAGPTLTKQFDAFVRKDALGWAFNKYDAGSLRNVKIISGTTKNGNFIMQGDYTYNGGNAGWVRASMYGNKLNCILFHDAVIGCRDPRTPEDGQYMRDVVKEGARNAISGGGGSSGSGAGPGCFSKADCDFVQWQQSR